MSAIIAACVPDFTCRRLRRRSDRDRARPAVTTSSGRVLDGATAVSAAVAETAVDLARRNDFTKKGGLEYAFVTAQAAKRDADQADIASLLQELPDGSAVDVAVVGCGPAGLALAAELGALGLKTALIGPEASFVNVYGVWCDEFESLGLQDCLEFVWPDTACYFDSDEPMLMGRPYGKVDRAKLRGELLRRCVAAGAGSIRYRATELAEAVPDAVAAADAAAADRQLAAPAAGSTLTCTDGAVLRARMVIIASGAASGRFIRFEPTTLEVGAQTAYGIMADIVPGTFPFRADAMHFMDFRRHHTGVVAGGGLVHASGYDAPSLIKWSPPQEVPSFLYAMPLAPGRVFLEETCLAAKPALPFATLKRRLARRLEALGITVTSVLEEEWSYIPVGGPLPVTNQPFVGYGAAANFVHPATGYSLVRSLREAAPVAAKVADALRPVGVATAAAAAELWGAIWPPERRRQAAFNTFGMELLAALDLRATCHFFTTFFSLPQDTWRRFLANRLSSGELVLFALAMFVLAPPSMKLRLVAHLVEHPSGAHMIDAYLGKRADSPAERSSE